RILDIRERGQDINLEFSYDVLALRAFLQQIDRDISRPAINASIERSGDTFTVTPEIQGIGINVDKTIGQIAQDLKTLDFSPKPVVVFDKIPSITSNMLSDIDTRWSIFSTVFNPENVGRSENIKISSQAIDGMLLGPGQVFSFNDATGLRIAENGYQEAPVIFEGQLVPGVGGGVCQVSSTLYNAALYANLEIVERHRHTIPSAYIDMGRDATVVDKVLDLKFRNNSDGYLYIASWVQGNRVYTAVYGKKRAQDIKVNISTEVVEVIEPVTEVVLDHALPAGQEVVEREGRKGYRVRAYRRVTTDGKAGEIELLYTDLYRPENRLIRRSAQPVVVDSPSESDEHSVGNII
ncbi:MAG: VanW family protein, partial [Mahellales bacterium]